MSEPKDRTPLEELQEARAHLEALVDIIDQEQPDISWTFVFILDAAREFIYPGYFGEAEDA